jgi:hypothetical protein
MGLMLFLTACGAAEIADFVEQTPTMDLSVSQDPALKAVAESADTIDDIRRAEEALELGLSNGDPTELLTASIARIEDPRYDLYRAALLTGEIEALSNSTDEFAIRDQNEAFDDLDDELDRAAAQIARQHPDATLEQREQILTEMYLDVLRDVILRVDGGRIDQDGVINTYCFWSKESPNPDRHPGFTPCG